MNQDPNTQPHAAPAPPKKGCGCGSLVIGAVVIVLVLILSCYIVLTRTALPMRVFASMLAKAEPTPLVMSGISGSSASGYRIARIESGDNHFEDVRINTTGILRMFTKQELIIREIHVGKARVTTEVLKSESEPESDTGTGASSGGDLDFFFQMDRLSLNDMEFTDSLTGTTLIIPKLEWAGFKAGRGEFELGNIHVDSNMLTVRTTTVAPGNHRIEATLLPDLHEHIRKSIPVVADIHYENDRIRSDVQAFDGALRFTDDPQTIGKILVSGLDLTEFIDGPLPRDIQLEIEMAAKPADGSERETRLLSGSFQLGQVPFTIQPADLTDATEIVATGTHGGTEFRYTIVDPGETPSNDLKPRLRSNPRLSPEAMLAKIFHDADPGDLTAWAEWFRFAD